MGDTTTYEISDVTVRDTRADGIHNTDGSSDGRIIRPRIYNSGDDGVSIVSYRTQDITHDILVESPEFYSNHWGRAYSVVGGSSVTFNNVYAEYSAAAGIYVAAESSFNTYGVNDVTFNGGTLVGVNTNASVDHGAILVFNGQPLEIIEDVTINNINIQNTNTAVSRNVGLLTAASTLGSNRIEFNTIAITGGPANPFGITGTNSHRRLNWTQNGSTLTDHSDY